MLHSLRKQRAYHSMAVGGINWAVPSWDGLNNIQGITCQGPEVSNGPTMRMWRVRHVLVGHVPQPSSRAGQQPLLLSHKRNCSDCSHPIQAPFDRDRASVLHQTCCFLSYLANAACPPCHISPLMHTETCSSASRQPSCRSLRRPSWPPRSRAIGRPSPTSACGACISRSGARLHARCGCNGAALPCSLMGCAPPS